MGGVCSLWCCPLAAEWAIVKSLWQLCVCVCVCLFVCRVYGDSSSGVAGYGTGNEVNPVEACSYERQQHRHLDPN